MSLLPLGDPAGAATSVVAGLAMDRFAQLPNGRPSEPEDLLAILLLCTLDVDPDAPDPKVVAAKVQMAKLGFGHRLPLTEPERLGLNLLTAWRLDGQSPPAIRRVLDQQFRTDQRALLRNLWQRCLGLWGRVEQSRATMEQRCEALAQELTHHLPSGLALRPHQLEGVLRARERDFRFLFADDMGLGKTIEMLTCALLLGDAAFPMLVCSPLSMVGKWKSEALKWMSRRDIVVRKLTKDAGPKQLLEDTQGKHLVMMGTWSQLVAHEGEVRAAKPGLFIGDESHYICGWESQRTQSAIRCRSSFGSVLLGTGTLMPNGRHIEAYPQLKMVAPDLFAYLKPKSHSEDGLPRGDRPGFLKHFCGPKKVFLGKDDKGREKSATSYKGRSHEVEFGHLIAEVMIRRTKSEVFGDDGLPPKTRYVIPVEISDAQRMRLARARDQIKAKIRKRAVQIEQELRAEGLPQERIDQRVKRTLSSEAVTLLSELRIKLGRIKADWSKQRVKELISEGHKIVVFGWHDEVIRAAADHYRKLGLSVLLGTGSMTGNKRDRIVAEAESGTHDVVVLSSAYREGITLVSYDRLIMLERWWIPGHEMQAEDRIHRIGQLREVAIEYPVIPNSYDDAVGELQVWKEQGQHQAQGSAQERTYQWLMAA